MTDAHTAEQLLRELDQYLSRSPAEAIHAGSIFHQQMKQVLSRRNAESTLPPKDVHDRLGAEARLKPEFAYFYGAKRGCPAAPNGGHWEIVMEQSPDGQYVSLSDPRHAEAIATQFASPPPAALSELGWLIEAKISPALWLQVDPVEKTYRWTNDANEAVRFARKADAENVIGLWSLMAAATEHVWCGGPAVETITFPDNMPMAESHGDPRITGEAGETPAAPCKHVLAYPFEGESGNLRWRCSNCKGVFKDNPWKRAAVSEKPAETGESSDGSV